MAREKEAVMRDSWKEKLYEWAIWIIVIALVIGISLEW